LYTQNGCSSVNTPESKKNQDDSNKPVVAETASGAGGLPSLVSASRHLLKEMGVYRGTMTMLRANQESGFDCPGCAWPEPQQRSVAEFCENGAKAIAAEATRQTLDAAFFRRYSITELNQQSDHWLESQGRLTEPMIRRPGATHFESVSWEEVFDGLASALNGLSDPNQAIFYTSGRTSNEAAFLYQLFARQFGTNNLPDSSNLCHESSGLGLSESIGIGKGTVQLEDFEKADAVFVFGQNPGTNHPRMLRALQHAARSGTKIVAINPLREPGLIRFGDPQELQGMLWPEPLAHLYLQLKINGDAALLRGVAKEVLEAERRRPGRVLDHPFIEEYTSGFDDYAAAVKNTSWHDIEEGSGLQRQQIREMADIYLKADSVIACWAMGLTQHRNGVANVQEVVNLQLLRGNIGRPGAGVCPVRGHSNVQGARTMGIAVRLKQDQFDKLADHFDFEPPKGQGYDAVQAIRAMHRGDAKVFVAMGGNFLAAAPDTQLTAEALRRCRLTAHVTTKLNRSQIVTGETGLMLPPLSRSERDRQKNGDQFVTVENSMGIIHRSSGRLAPASRALLSEAEIVKRLALATLPERFRATWRGLTDDYDRIRERISAVVSGVDGLNEKVREAGGLKYPNQARLRRFNTKGGRARFMVHALPKWDLPAGRFLMMTIRSHDQYNTTVYGLGDRYRGLKNARRAVLINAADMAMLEIKEGDEIVLTSYHDGKRRTLEGFFPVAYDIPRGCVAAYFPETNPLVPIECVAERSNTPAYKSVVVGIAKGTGDERGRA